MDDADAENLAIIIAAEEDVNVINFSDYVSLFFGVDLFTKPAGIPLPISMEKLGGNAFVYKCLDAILGKSFGIVKELEGVVEYHKSVMEDRSIKSRAPFDSEDIYPSALLNYPLPTIDRNMKFLMLIRLKHALVYFVRKLYNACTVHGEPSIGPANSVESLLSEINSFLFDFREAVGMIWDIGAEELVLRVLPPREMQDMQYLISVARPYYDDRDSALLKANYEVLHAFLSEVIEEHQQPTTNLRKLISRNWKSCAAGTVGICVVVWALCYTSLFEDGLETLKSLISGQIVEPLGVIKDSYLNKSPLLSELAILQPEAKHYSRQFSRVLTDFTLKKSQKDANLSATAMFQKLAVRDNAQMGKPIWNFIFGDLIRVKLIQGQKVFLDVAETKLEKNYNLRLYEVPLALLRMLPAGLLGFVIFGAGVYIYWKDSNKKWSKNVKDFSILLKEANKRLQTIDCMLANPEPRVLDISYQSGLLLCLVDLMFKTANSADWNWLKEQLIQIGHPDVEPFQKREILKEIRCLECLWHCHK